jgi:hypothetical protein
MLGALCDEGRGEIFAVRTPPMVMTKVSPREAFLI